jgi:hypothetical protein
LIKQDRPSGLNAGSGGGSNQLIGDVVATSVNSRSMDDQMELVKSTAMARMVVRNAALQQSYYYKGSVRNTLVHNSASPVQLNILNISDSSNGLSLVVKVVGKETFILNQNPTPIRFGALFQLPSGSFVLEKKYAEIAANTEFICNWTPEEPLARSLAGSINVGVATKGGNVLNFVYSSENHLVAQDVVNGFLRAYQDYSLQDKREGSLSALNFIDDQLAQVKGDLSNVEGTLQQFREDNKVIAPEAQANSSFTEAKGSDKQIMEQSIKIRFIDYMINFIKDPKNNYRSIPMVSLVNEGSVGAVIGEYNKPLKTKTHYFVLPKNLNLKAADIRKNLKVVSGGYQLTLQTDNLAKNVMIGCRKGLVDCSDNFFDILPKSSKTIFIKTSLKLTESDLYWKALNPAPER